MSRPGGHIACGRAARLGASGGESVAGITWEAVVTALTAALGFEPAKSERAAWA